MDKPSELTFFAALGIPDFAPPMGRTTLQSKMGHRERCRNETAEPRGDRGWLTELLREGTLSSMAWSGYIRLPKTGLYEIADGCGGKAPISDL